MFDTSVPGETFFVNNVRRVIIGFGVRFGQPDKIKIRVAVKKGSRQEKPAPERAHITEGQDVAAGNFLPVFAQKFPRARRLQLRVKDNQRF